MCLTYVSGIVYKYLTFTLKLLTDLFLLPLEAIFALRNDNELPVGSNQSITITTSCFHLGAIRTITSFRVSHENLHFLRERERGSDAK